MKTQARPEARRTEGLGSGGQTQLVLKRVLDVVGAALLAVPALVVVGAFAVPLALTGGVIHRQTRVGAGGKEFTIHKLRTMREHGADDRRTALGKALRASSLDEVPQVYDVLRGRMSLVGPRPRLPHEPRSPALARTPGMTGPSQVSGRKDLSWETVDALEEFYDAHWCLRLDALVLLRTPRVVLDGHGAR